MSKRHQFLTLAHNPNSTGLVPILELLDQNPPVRKFVGLKFKKINLDGTDRYQLVEKAEGDRVKYHPEYKKAVQEGILIPLNQETADLCQVPFLAETQISSNKRKISTEFK